MGERTAAVLTVSDGVSRGSREDRSGPAVASRLVNAGFLIVRTAVVPDDRTRISDLLSQLVHEARLVVTTGGTGLASRDVTPEATRDVIEREVPGLGEAMRAAGRRSTPLADLSRGVVGASGGTLVVNVPGGERAAIESLDAILETLPHALDVLADDGEHGQASR